MRSTICSCAFFGSDRADPRVVLQAGRGRNASGALNLRLQRRDALGCCWADICNTMRLGRGRSRRAGGGGGLRPQGLWNQNGLENFPGIQFDLLP